MGFVVERRMRSYYRQRGSLVLLTTLPGFACVSLRIVASVSIMSESRDRCRLQYCCVFVVGASLSRDGSGSSTVSCKTVKSRYGPYLLRDIAIQTLQSSQTFRTGVKPLHFDGSSWKLEICLNLISFNDQLMIKIFNFGRESSVSISTFSRVHINYFPNVSVNWNNSFHRPELKLFILFREKCSLISLFFQ